MEKITQEYKKQSWYTKYIDKVKNSNSQTLIDAFSKVIEEAIKREKRFMEINNILEKISDYSSTIKEKNDRIILTKLCDEINCYFKENLLIDQVKSIRKIKKEVSDEVFLLAVNVYIAHYAHYELPKGLLPFYLFSLLINMRDKMIVQCEHWLYRMGQNKDTRQIVLSYYDNSTIKSEIESLLNKKYTNNVRYLFSEYGYFKREHHSDEELFEYRVLFCHIQHLFSKYDFFKDEQGENITIEAIAIGESDQINNEKKNAESSEDYYDMSSLLFEIFFDYETQFSPLYSKAFYSSFNVKKKRKHSTRLRSNRKKNRMNYLIEDDDNGFYYALYSFYNTYIVEKLQRDLNIKTADNKLLECLSKICAYFNDLSHEQVIEHIVRFDENNEMVISEIMNDIINCEDNGKYLSLVEQYISSCLQYLMFSTFSIGETSADIKFEEFEIDQYLDTPYEILIQKTQKNIDHRDEIHSVFGEIESFHRKYIENKTKGDYSIFNKSLYKAYIDKHFE